MKKASFLVALLMLTRFGSAAAADMIDTDGDGIPDGQDYCTQTPAGAAVWTSGEWAGCAQGQQRDSDLAAAITKCEVTADDQIGSLHIYERSSCAPYGLEVNRVGTPYVEWTRPVLGRPLNTLGNGYLLYRVDFCKRTAAAVAQVIANMRASGCDPGPRYGGSSGGSSGSGG